MQQEVDPGLAGARGSQDVPCRRCGRPTANLGDVCDPCLVGHSVLAEGWRKAREVLHADRPPQIVLARDKRTVQHLVLFGSPGVAWCGARVTEKLAKRRSARAGHFPTGVCRRCLEKYAELQR